jgi:hypothetical protein
MCTEKSFWVRLESEDADDASMERGEIDIGVQGFLRMRVICRFSMTTGGSDWCHCSPLRVSRDSADNTPRA